MRRSVARLLESVESSRASAVTRLMRRSAVCGTERDGRSAGWPKIGTAIFQNANRVQELKYISLSLY